MARALLGSASGEEPLADRVMGDPLLVDSKAAVAAVPSLRFSAARDAYYVVQCKTSPGDPAWTPCDVILTEQGEQYWSGSDPLAEPCVLFRLAEYPLDQPGDQDGEGMDDVWEKLHQLNPLDPTDAQLDPDGDLRNNLQECTDGTDPGNPDSQAPSIQVLHPVPGQTVFWIP